MELRISIREANQHLSRYLEKVEHGDEVIITRRGTPVAKLVKTDAESSLTEEQQAARERMRECLTKGLSLGGETFDRDAIHQRGEAED